MADRFRLTLAQLNPTVGDLAGNARLALAAWEEGRANGADLVALPEMFITGYNTQDLVRKPAFHQAAIAAIEALARDCAEGPALAIGGPALEGAGLAIVGHVGAEDRKALFAALERARADEQELDAEFRRLDAERRAASTHLRVEQVARERLRMHGAHPGVTLYVPDPGAPGSSAAVGAAP
jgi:predicted amidohydrolase